MLIVGEWQVGDDGMTRPVVRAEVLGLDGSPIAEGFLVDSGADRTVLSAAVLERLHLPVRRGQPGLTLSGIGGESDFVLVSTAIVFVREDGGAARIRGELAGFTDLTTTDLSILGRDVLDHFDIVLSRRRNEVLLLAPNHRYHIERG
jgi:hypothetical protein